MHDGSAVGEVQSVEIRSGISLHFMGEGGILFDWEAQRLYGTNTMATFIWCHLENGLPLSAIAQLVGETFAVSAVDATTHVALSLDQWRALGLLGSQGIWAPGPADRTTRIRRQPSSTVPPTSRQCPVASHEYRLLDTSFRLSFSSRLLLSEVAPVLTPLADATGEAREDLHLVATADRIALCHEGIAIDDCQGWDGVVPMLKAALVLFALDRSDDFAAVHAAAVIRDGRCFLIPGESGQGKSTLSAALVAAGFCLLGDDTIVLARETLNARAIPFSICLKEGSWPLLASRFPALAERPVHLRGDGTLVRYLAPGRDGGWAAPSLQTPVDGIVLLARGTGQPAGLALLDPVEAFPRFLQDFYPLRGGLDAAKVERLVQWMGQRRCAELRYDTLEEGVSLMRMLCS